MKEKPLPYSRGPEILRMLYEHGPLSTRIIRKIAQPPMSHRKVRAATRRLFERGYIVRRFDGLPKNVGNYYQLSHRKETRAKIASVLGMSPDNLREPMVRDQELYHSEICATWAHLFKQVYPEARVLRDHKIGKDEEALRVLLSDSHQLELRPDVMLFFPGKEGKEAVSIAIEVERSRKANSRIVEKLKKLSAQSLLDGVIYVSSFDYIKDAVISMYEIHVRPRSPRISHYGKNFVMFMNIDPMVHGNGIALVNSQAEITSTHDWIQFLRSTPRNFRRDANFPLEAQLG